MMILLLNVLCSVLISLQVFCTDADANLGHLPIDGKTGFLRYTPDLTNMTTEEIVKFRDIILYNPGHEKYCKVTGLPNDLTWWHWRQPNWCRRETESNGWIVTKYEDLCCGDHGSCFCYFRNAHCQCEL